MKSALDKPQQLRLTAPIVIHFFIVLVYCGCEWTYTTCVNSLLTDFGASYHACKLIDSGLIPYRDFGYNYGGLGLILVDFFHYIVGYSLFNHALIMYACVLFCFALIYWFLVKSKQSPVTSLIILSASLYYFSTMWTPAFMLESLFITGAIIMMYFRRYSSALLLASMSFLIRPAISVYFITFVGCSILYQAYSEKSWRTLIKAFAPSLMMSILAIVLIYARFGLPAVIGSLFPQSSLAAYKQNDYGVHNLFRLFYDGTDLASSLGSVIADKQIVLALFFFVVIRVGYYWIRRYPIRTSRIHLVALVVSAIYLLFLFTMYGNAKAWLNYAYLLTWCLPLSDLKTESTQLNDSSERTSVSYGSLCFAIVLFSYLHLIIISLAYARYMSVVNLNGNNVFIRTGYDERVNTVLSELNGSGEEVLFLGWGGCVDEIYPRIHTSRSWVVVAGVSNEREIEYVINQLAKSDVVVETISVISPTRIDAIQQALASREKIATNEWVIYKRIPLAP